MNEPDLQEGASQYLGRQCPRCQVIAVQLEVRRRRRVPCDLLGVPVIVRVVASRASSDGQGNGQVVPPTTCASHTLLVVEPLRWHVRHDDRLECTDVNSRLHGRRDAQDVDLVDRRYI